MVMAHAAIAFWHQLHPRINKNMELQTVPKFASPSHRKSQNCPAKPNQKSMKTDIWESVCPLGVPRDPRITKMVSQLPKKTSQSFKNKYKSNPLRQSACQQLLAARRTHLQSSLILQPAMNSLQIAVHFLRCLILAVGAGGRGRSP